MPTPTPTAAAQTDAQRRAPEPEAPRRVRRTAWFLELYRSALGKKYVMALTGIFLIGWVTAHTIGNMKLYLGAEATNHYSEWLRTGLGTPIVPETVVLWLVRVLLIGSFVLHIHAAYALTVMNRRARPVGYQSERDYLAANFAARTMRWTGIIVALFVIYHLLDLTWGVANPGGRWDGEAYENVVQSLTRWPVALFYVLGNVALAYHLYHGTWSLFQSMGWNKPRFNIWRKYAAVAVALFIGLANISFPFAVLFGVVQ